MVGRTTIKIRDRAIPLISKLTSVPRSKDTVPGTTRGAARVSKRIIAKAKALSPWYIETQMKPDTAVGTEKSSTYPEIVSASPLNKTLQLKNTIKGISAWAKRKNRNMGKGCCTALPKSLARNFKDPDRVITAKNHGTKNRSWIITGDNTKPSTTPEGVSTGISRSSRAFRAEAVSATFFFEVIPLDNIYYLYGEDQMILSNLQLVLSIFALVVYGIWSTSLHLDVIMSKLQFIIGLGFIMLSGSLAMEAFFHPLTYSYSISRYICGAILWSFYGKIFWDGYQQKCKIRKRDSSETAA
jgi:hypothetical protein